MRPRSNQWERVLLGRNVQLHNKDWYWLILCAFKYDYHQTRFLPLRSIFSVFFRLQNNLYFLRRSRSRSGQTKVGEWRWEQSARLGRDGNRSFHLRSVRLRLESIHLHLICQFACVCENLMQAPWKAISWKKKNDCIAVYTFFLRALNFEKIENVS